MKKEEPKDDAKFDPRKLNNESSLIMERFKNEENKVIPVHHLRDTLKRYSRKHPILC